LGVLWEAGFRGGIGFIGEGLYLSFLEWSIFIPGSCSGNSFHDTKLIVRYYRVADIIACMVHGVVFYIVPPWHKGT
jgi:hypothetical protein